MDRPQREAEFRVVLTSPRGKEELLALLKEHAGLDEGKVPPPEAWHVEVILRYEVPPGVTTVPMRGGVGIDPPEQAPEDPEPGDVKLEEPPGMESPGG